MKECRFSAPFRKLVHNSYTVPDPLIGSVTDDASACIECGIDAYFPIVRGVSTLEEACDNENARKNMAAAAEQAARLIKLTLSFPIK